MSVKMPQKKKEKKKRHCIFTSRKWGDFYVESPTVLEHNGSVFSESGHMISDSMNVILTGHIPASRICDAFLIL